MLHGFHIHVERKVEIDAPPARIYERIADFRRWSTWSPFEDLDPDLDRRYEGSSSGVDAVYEWSGNLKAGAGRMEIVNTVEGERIVINQRNHKPFKSESTTTFTLSASGRGTIVTWTATGPLTLGPKIMGIFKSMDGLIGPIVEKGLENLRAESEAERITR